MLTSAGHHSTRSLKKEAARWQRNLRTAAALLQAVPAAVHSPPAAGGGGFLSSLFGGRRKAGPTVPPLFEPLPDVPAAPPLSVPSSLSTELTTLSNGLRIASEATPGATSTVGIYIDSGSVYESPAQAGTSHLLERMAFKTTANRTHFRLIREVEAVGGNIAAAASREQMAYTGDALKTYLPEMLEIVVDSVRNPIFNEWEVKEQLERVREEVQGAASNPQSLVLEALHHVGYTGALANPLLCPDSQLNRLNGEALFEFVQANYSAPRMVLAGAGPEHEELVSLAEPLLGDLPNTPPPPPPRSRYVGGDWRAAADTPLTHVAFGFEFPGGWRNDKEAVAVTVLQTLMGGGGSFSAGGPGKGMYSRLYRRVLNNHGEVQSCTAFNSIYNDTGIFGIHATANPGFAAKLVDIISDEFTALVGAKGLSEEELQRAKNATISSVLMNLETRVVVCEDVGRQILTYGHRKSPEDFVASVQALTLDDLKAVVKKVLGTPLSLATYGDVVSVPRFDEVARRFG